MPDVTATDLPFAEAIAHLRAKVNVPTRWWDQMAPQLHARAFTVAGATKAALLSDIRELVDQAIADGTSFADFRRGFRKAVEKHGWALGKKTGWRARVIYDTNMATAHAAGKWMQLQRTKETRPYLRYETAMDGAVRPEHAAWQDIVVHIDDPWLDTNYPPNGWGCRCFMSSMSQEELEASGLTAGASAIETSERVNTRTGEVYGRVPVGIDTGWDYNVGKAWIGPDAALGETMASMPSDMAGAAAMSAAAIARAMSDDVRAWSAELDGGEPLGTLRPVGYLPAEITSRAAASGEVVPPLAVILDQDVATSAIRSGITPDDIATIPYILRSPTATQRAGSTVTVSGDGIAIEIDISTRRHPSTGTQSVYTITAITR